MEILEWLLARIGEIEGVYAYLVVFTLLMACGLGLPLPEDITLIAAGLLAFEGNANVYTMIAVSFVGIMGGDSLIFGIGSRYGNKVLKWRIFSKFLGPDRLAHAQRLLLTRGNKLIFFARFMPGLRAPIYFTAGSLQLPFKTFFFFDSMAALISVPAIVYATYHFGEDVENVIRAVRKFEYGILILVGSVVTFFVLKWWLRRRQNKNQRVSTQSNEI